MHKVPFLQLVLWLWRNILVREEATYCVLVNCKSVQQGTKAVDGIDIALRGADGYSPYRIQLEIQKEFAEHIKETPDTLPSKILEYWAAFAVTGY